MSTTSTPLLAFSYGFAVVLALFTGFGNMPLWGRYYVSDLPGLGWSGNFIVNVNVHILAGSLLLGIGVFALTQALLMGKATVGKMSLSGKIRGLLLALALITGILMVVKNLPGMNFSLATLMVFNFTHLGASVLFLLFSLVALVFRQPWRRIH